MQLSVLALLFQVTNEKKGLSTWTAPQTDDKRVHPASLSSLVRS